MDTKLSTYCDKLIEAGWLAAAIVAPLFFNVYSSRVFEPDKITLVRSIALVMSLAWVVKMAEQGLARGVHAPRGPALSLSNGPRGDQAATGFVTRPLSVTPYPLSQVPALRQGSGQALLARSLGLIRANPLALPALLLTAVYILSTLLSVYPHISFWGSYHRLQGTYSLLSYVVIFFSILHGLRTREQLDRLISTMLLASVPVLLYSLAQRLGLDPLPWSAEVTGEPKANMGNSIFLGAYLILVLPLVLGRLLETLIALRRRDGSLTSVLLRLAGYSLLLLVLMVTILFTGSRGPWMGLMGGGALFVALAILVFGSRRLMFGALGVGATLFAFVVVLNLPGSPLASLRELPYVGMLGELAEAGPGSTIQVRLLIWEEVARLVQADPRRALIGYGPESLIGVGMRFYQPELAYAEARGALPDRSHNETFDVLATTGLVGLAAWLGVVISLLYYVLKWLGLIRSGEQRLIFLFLLGMQILLGVVVPRLLAGTFLFLAVGLPLGVVAGVLMYLLIYTLFYYSPNPEARHFGFAQCRPGSGRRVRSRASGPSPKAPDLGLRTSDSGSRTSYAILLIALCGAVVAHFLEINFAIAIAATRTYFWIFAALIAVISRWLVAPPAADTVAETGSDAHVPLTEPVTSAEPVPSTGSGLALSSPKGQALSSVEGLRPALSEAEVTSLSLSKGSELALSEAKGHRRQRGGRRRTRLPLRGVSAGSRHLISRSLLVTLILVTLAYEFIVPQFDLSAQHYVVVWLFGVTWLAGAVFALGGGPLPQPLPDTGRGEGRGVRSIPQRSVLGKDWANLLLRLLVYSLLTLVPLVLFAPAHQNLLRATNTVPNALVLYYIVLGLTLLGLAAGLLVATPLPQAFWRPWRGWVYPFLAAAVVVLVFTTNISVVRADTYYKQGQYFDGNQWDEAIAHYRQAVSTGPTEDYYYLYLGRAYMEQAKAAEDPEEQATLMEQARDTFERAVALNPLNIDHLANLARFYYTWASMADAPELRAERLDRSLDWYRRATEVSPNQPHLYNEWANVYRYDKNDTETALELLKQSLRVDPKYDETYVRLGGLFFELGQEDEAQRQKYFEQAIEVYRALTQLPTYYTRDRNNLFIAWDHLGYLYAQLGETEEAIHANLQALEYDPNSYNNHKNLALLYQEQGRLEEAIAAAQKALDLAPEDEKGNLAAYLAQLKGEEVPPPAPLISEADTSTGLSTSQRLVQTYLEQGKLYLEGGDLDRAAEAYQQALALNPNLLGAHSYLGLIYARQGKVEEAIRENQSVLQFAPNDFDSHKNLAILYQQQGRLEEALSEAQTALQSAPEDQKAAMEVFISQLQGQLDQQ